MKSNASFLIILKSVSFFAYVQPNGDNLSAFAYLPFDFFLHAFLRELVVAELVFVLLSVLSSN